MGNSNTSLIRKPYCNYKMYHPDGTLMCFCSSKRANWYVSRNLGIIKDNNINLTFIPRGYGEPDLILQSRKNCCVICETETELTKHHIIPTQYRKHFNNVFKDKNSMDLAILCRIDHNAYELLADEFKEQLYTDYIDNNIYQRFKDLRHVQNKYKTLKNYINEIPPDKYVYMQMVIDGLIDKWKFSIDEIESSCDDIYDSINKIIVEKLGEINLIVLWKLHFIKYGKPKFMPDWWKPNLIKIIKSGKNNFSKSDLCEIDLKNKKLYTLIKKYKLDEIANLYI